MTVSDGAMVDDLGGLYSGVRSRAICFALPTEVNRHDQADLRENRGRGTEGQARLTIPATRRLDRAFARRRSPVSIPQRPG